MADTGILLRGNTFNEIMADKPIHREAVITEKGLLIGYDSGSGVEVFKLNLQALVSIGKIALDGTITQGLKTSDIPIIFDGAGDLKVTNTHVILQDVHKLTNTLSFIKEVNFSGITITDLGDPENTKYISWDSLIGQSLPVLTLPSTTKVQVAGSVGTTVVLDEAEAQIGLTSTDGEVTFSTAQASGVRVYAYNIDIDKNKSKRVSILIP